MKNFKVCYEFPISVFILYSPVLLMIFLILYQKNIISFRELQIIGYSLKLLPILSKCSEPKFENQFIH